MTKNFKYICTITGTALTGGMLNATIGGAYFDLNNGKLYPNNATLKGSFEVAPTSSTCLHMRRGVDAVRLINGLWNTSGQGIRAQSPSKINNSSLDVIAVEWYYIYK